MVFILKNEVFRYFITDDFKECIIAFFSKKNLIISF